MVGVPPALAADKDIVLVTEWNDRTKESRCCDQCIMTHYVYSDNTSE